MGRIKSIIKLIRVYQWTKQGFIFLPFVFSEKLHTFIWNPLGSESVESITAIILAFLGFSFLASSGYVLNDWKDVELDRADPRKKHRPLASGALPASVGLIIALILFVAAFVIAYRLNMNVVTVFAAYFLFNMVFYSYLGKRIILVDVFMISIGFVLRVMVGAFALNIEASPWLLMCTFFIALFLGFAKRYYEVRTGPGEILLGGAYKTETLQNFMVISATLTIMAYATYCIQGKHAAAHLIYTVPFVVMGIFRYYIITHDEKLADGNPSDVLIADKFMIINILIWLALCASLILYYQPGGAG